LPTAQLLARAPGLRGDHAAKLSRLKVLVNVRLWAESAVEVPVFVCDGQLAVRVSLPLYVTASHISKLAEGVLALLRGPLLADGPALVDGPLLADGPPLADDPPPAEPDGELLAAVRRGSAVGAPSG